MKRVAVVALLDAGWSGPVWVKPIAILVLLAALAVACTTRLIPQAEHVRVTRKAGDVATCKSLGFVEARPPFSTPNDAMNEMKNKVAVLGGDVLFVTNYSMKATGVAYRCADSGGGTP